MRDTAIRRLFWLVVGVMLLGSLGCDAANIVFASLDLAAAIVEAAS